MTFHSHCCGWRNQRSDAQMWCSICWTSIKKNTFCIVWSFPHWETSNRKQQWYYLSVFIKGVGLVVLIPSECKAWKCFHDFICNNKLVSQLLEASCILKGNVVFLKPVLQWVKDGGCFFLASPPCAGMSAGAYWTVAAAFWPTSWPPLLHRLPFYSTTSVVFLHKCERALHI